MLRLYRLNHHGAPLYAAERAGRWRLVDGDIFGAFTEGAEVTSDGASWLAPVTPSKIVTVGMNYKPVGAAAERGLPVEPALGFKPPSSVVGPGAAIELPADAGRVDHRAALGVVIRKTARRVRANKAAEHILGLVALNDVVRRGDGEDGAAPSGARAACYDTFAPVGPCIAVGLDGRDLQLRAYVNGGLRQDARTRDMIFTIPELVEFVSACMTLAPGDIICTGTPAGAGPIVAGDQVTIHVEGVGALTNPVVSRGE